MLKQYFAKKLQANRLGALALITTTLACGGTVPPETGPQLKQGQFIDSYVNGICYDTETQSGVTTNEGHFNYLEGETVTFRLCIADIQFPSVEAAELLTPVILAAQTDIYSDAVVNMARFLQSLDDDANPENGINIPSELDEIDTIGAINFFDTIENFGADDSPAQTFIGDLAEATGNPTSPNALVSVESAMDHLSQQIYGESRPRISNVFPKVISEGEKVKISGRHLEDADVSLGGAAVSITLKTDTEIQFIVPSLPVGAVSLELSNSLGNSSSDLEVKETTKGEALSMSYTTLCILQDDGAVECQGYSAYGTMGNGFRGWQPFTETTSSTGSAVKISSGWDHMCVILDDASLECWGRNKEGQMGLGTTDNYQTTPATVPGLSVVSVAGGYEHTCAALTDGTVRCWGENGAGQFGDGTTVSSSSPVVVPGLTDVVEVKMNWDRTCVVHSNGTVSCWRNTTPMLVDGLENVVTIEMGRWHQCALHEDQTVSCWGSNGEGQLGVDPDVSSPGVVSVAGLSNISAISTGYEHSCALGSFGVIKCWGGNEWGQLGNALVGVRSHFPVTVAGVAGASALASTNNSSCVVLSDDEIRCWGSTKETIHGYATTGNYVSPSTTSGLAGSVNITSGYSHSCAQLEDGTVKCWGLNLDGQVGDGTEITPITPATIPEIANAVKIAPGRRHSCAIMPDTSVKCWGSNVLGAVGDGTTENKSSPVVVAGLNAIDIATGFYGSCAVNTSNEVYCWGLNIAAGGGNVLSPAAVGVSNAIAVSVGSDHACAVINDGSVRCWGDNRYGKLGDGTDVDAAVPVSVLGITSAVDVVASYRKTCALNSEGEVYCWGHFASNQSGIWATNFVPTKVEGLANRAVSLSGMDGSSCVLLNDGTVQCFGNKCFSGEQGDGFVVNPGTAMNCPNRIVTVEGIADAVDVSLGFDHGCAVLSNGEVQCWGDNSFGQLASNLPPRNTDLKGAVKSK